MIALGPRKAALIDALALSQIGRVGARSAGAETAVSESRALNANASPEAKAAFQKLTADIAAWRQLNAGKTPGNDLDNYDLGQVRSRPSLRIGCIRDILLDESSSLSTKVFIRDQQQRFGGLANLSLCLPQLPVAGLDDATDTIPASSKPALLSLQRVSFLRERDIPSFHRTNVRSY